MGIGKCRKLGRLLGSRISLASLRVQICRKLGKDKAQRYFSYLNRLLGHKLSKATFDKLCLNILGQENLLLHNQFICTILKNASQAKVPPPAVHNKKKMNPSIYVGKEFSLKDDVLHPSLKAKVNGVILRRSSRMCQVMNCGTKDLPSFLSSNGKVHDFSYRSQAPQEKVTIKENGDFISSEYQQAGSEEFPRMKQHIEKSLSHDQVSVHSKDPVKVVVENLDAKQVEDAPSDRDPLRAPLGIPFCSASIGGAHRNSTLPSCSIRNKFPSCSDSGLLYHTEALRRRMEQIAEAQGLEGVSMDCANLLNNGLDAYLKQLVRSCVDLLRGKLGRELMKDPIFKQQSHRKILNGIWPGNNMHIQYGAGYHLEGREENYYPVSMLDFRVALELKPQQLGEDWPLLLEKVYFRSFEE